MAGLASYIDHTLLDPDAHLKDFHQLIDESFQQDFASVCVPSGLLNALIKHPHFHKVNTAVVIGFPFGYSSLESKIKEMEVAADLGAKEFDFVSNRVMLHSEDEKTVVSELSKILNFTRQRNLILKWIVESGNLNPDEMEKVVKVANRVNPDFVKTSSGFREMTDLRADIQYFRAHLHPEIKVKASGGIKSSQMAEELIKLGADRIGTSSAMQWFK